MISFADFKMEANRPAHDCLVFEMLKQNSSYSEALRSGFYGEQK